MLVLSLFFLKQSTTLCFWLTGVVTARDFQILGMDNAVCCLLLWLHFLQRMWRNLYHAGPTSSEIFEIFLISYFALIGVWIMDKATLLEEHQTRNARKKERGKGV